MTIPSLVIGLIIALFVGTLFHLVRGGNGWQLLSFIGLSIAGFFFAQWMGSLLDWALYKLGSLDIALGVIGSILFNLMGEWLLKSQPKKP